MATTKKFMAMGQAFATQTLAEQFAVKEVRPGQTIVIDEIDCTAVSQVSLPPAVPTVTPVPTATTPAAPAA